MFFLCDVRHDYVYDLIISTTNLVYFQDSLSHRNAVLVDHYDWMCRMCLRGCPNVLMIIPIFYSLFFRIRFRIPVFNI